MVTNLDPASSGGNENASLKKMNLHPFKLYRVYFEPLNLSQTCATIPGVEFLRTLTMSKNRKENLSLHVHVLHKTSHKEVLLRSRAKSMSKKCTNVWCKSRATSFPGFSLSSLEKEPWLPLVTWKCVLINCAAGVGSPLNFVHWTMKYYLG